MTELTGYRHITEAIERWRASGLYVPCDSAESRRRLQQVWLERYKKTDADSFMECVKVLSAGTHFPPPVRYGSGAGRGAGAAEATGQDHCRTVSYFGRQVRIR